MFCCLIAAFQKLVNVSKYLDVLNNILLNGKPEIQIPRCGIFQILIILITYTLKVLKIALIYPFQFIVESNNVISSQFLSDLEPGITPGSEFHNPGSRDRNPRFGVN